MIRTVVLVSTENFVWHSMQEIIPSLEQHWLQSQQDQLHDVKSVNIDQLSIKDYLPLLFAADNIVITCFTFKMAQLTKFFRDELRLKARYIVHLHNQSTIACWPFHKFSLGGQLHEDDIFISSCSRDQKTFLLGFEKARVECVPFTFSKGMAPDMMTVVKKTTDKNFVFIGRLSVQKNLHTLLWAFAIFMQRNPGYKGQLIFVGGEDDLGSPNMDMKSPGYQEYLQSLVQLLSLQQKVVFKGHMQREELYRELDSQDYVFVTPSLHSDENFGMAVFRALVEGRNAVLTDWGGHTDYVDYFKDQVHLIPVYGESMGPWISPYQLAECLEEVICKDHHGYHLPAYYQSQGISKKYQEIALTRESSMSPLKRSILADSVLQAREQYSSESATKIFRSYDDPNVQPFFKGYGMGAFEESKTQKRLFAVPWLKADVGMCSVQDIHRGSFQFESLLSEDSVEVQFIDGSHRKIALSVLSILQANGWIVTQL